MEPKAIQLFECFQVRKQITKNSKMLPGLLSASDNVEDRHQVTPQLEPLRLTIT